MDSSYIPNHVSLMNMLPDPTWPAASGAGGAWSDVIDTAHHAAGDGREIVVMDFVVDFVMLSHGHSRRWT